MCEFTGIKASNFIGNSGKANHGITTPSPARPAKNIRALQQTLILSDEEYRSTYPV